LEIGVIWHVHLLWMIHRLTRAVCFVNRPYDRHPLASLSLLCQSHRGCLGKLVTHLACILRFPQALSCGRSVHLRGGKSNLGDCLGSRAPLTRHCYSVGPDNFPFLYAHNREQTFHMTGYEVKSMKGLELRTG
jgi:hypothetical protein